MEYISHRLKLKPTLRAVGLLVVGCLATGVQLVVAPAYSSIALQLFILWGVGVVALLGMRTAYQSYVHQRELARRRAETRDAGYTAPPLTEAELENVLQESAGNYTTKLKNKLGRLF